MIVCVPVTDDGMVDPRWGRAGKVAVADVKGGAIASWREFEVRWDEQHDIGSEGGHHARVAQFLREHRVEVVVANHMGPPMAQMLDRLGILARLEAHGDARRAVVAMAAGATDPGAGAPARPRSES